MFVQLEETPEILTRDTSHLLDLDAVNPRETARHLNDIRRLVSLATIWYRSQVWTISLDQQTIERDFPRDRTQFFSLLERDDTRKRDHETQFDCPLRQIHAAAEAMEDSSTLSAVVFTFQNLDRLRLGFACVNHYRQITFARGSKLTLEHFDLHVAW